MLHWKKITPAPSRARLRKQHAVPQQTAMGYGIVKGIITWEYSQRSKQPTNQPLEKHQKKMKLPESMSSVWMKLPQFYGSVIFPETFGLSKKINTTRGFQK